MIYGLIYATFIAKLSKCWYKFISFEQNKFKFVVVLFLKEKIVLKTRASGATRVYNVKK